MSKVETLAPGPLPGRLPSALDERCDSYITSLAKINPIAAIEWGIGSPEGRLPDYSPAGIAKQAQLGADLLEFVQDPDQRSDFDGTDLVTAAALTDRLGLEQELYAAGELERTLNNITSPLQEVRDSFDLLPKDSPADWAQATAQLAAVPTALGQFVESLQLAASRGQVAARRQVQIAASQAAEVAHFSSPDSFFARLVREGNRVIGENRGLSRAAELAAAAYGELSAWLTAELLPQAPKEDAVGLERYERFSRLFVGAKVDLDETYAWGLEELTRIDRQQRDIAAELYGPGTDPQDAQDRLNQDPNLTLHGADALQAWMQETADRAISSLDGTEFDIPAPLREIECMIAPSSGGGIYYTAPTADFSRPGRMWWSVPPEETEFRTWQERTTVYHEGAPGHHLQIGLAMLGAAQPNLWRKLDSWYSGYGEGWALYAEQLMVELGYQNELPDLMGVLDAQRLRAARVVLDIGVHLQKPRPDGGGTWDAAYAWDFLKENVAMADGFLRFELDRYLGWPGQAPSYKIGERLWFELRREYLAKVVPGRPVEEGRRRFHSEALQLGSLPMDTLREVLIGKARP